ncbi:hypothetical protein [Thermoflexibacter ruber]|uniref:DUF4440 domain-containing protein n=1 Tax=Thermoflexibacter ruber TaxID=1003 RepID=A0A1I2I9C9_9BACT|nr:hypothetical protein [Thermoflexibacter ruber]SFF37737.1 hypothetical protein SAMN04488541_102921 [Thermoflexibacter ruber]
MKNIFLCLLVVGNLQMIFAQSQEEAAICKAIEEETLYRYSHQFDKWADCWVQKPTSFFCYTSMNMSFQVYGWSAIYQDIKEYASKFSADDRVTFQNENYKFSIYKDVAWVTYTQKSKDGKQSLHQRILEKVNKQWKITNLTEVTLSDYIQR